MNVFFTREGITLVDAAAWRSGPWANGGGVTHTIATWPADPPPDIRLSVAEISGPGPFSRFAGHQRWLAVIDDGGGPLRLELGATPAAQSLRTGDALGFSGDEPVTVTATPPGPLPARVFNLILRQPLRFRAEWLPTASSSTSTSPPGILAVFAPATPITATITATIGAHTLTIPALATAIVTSRTPITTDLHGAPAIRIWIGPPEQWEHPPDEGG